MKRIILGISLLMFFNSQAYAGYVVFDSELEKREKGKEYRFILQDVVENHQGQKVILFSSCTAEMDKENDEDRVLYCRNLGESSGYLLSDLEFQAQKLFKRGVVEKVGTTATLFIGGGALFVYGGLRIIASAFNYSHQYGGAFLTNAMFSGGPALVVASVPYALIDWTLSGNLRKSRTISKELDFYKNNRLARGSLSDFDLYVDYLSRALEGVNPASWLFDGHGVLRPETSMIKINFDEIYNFSRDIEDIDMNIAP